MGEKESQTKRFIKGEKEYLFLVYATRLLMAEQNQPIYILPEGYQRTLGKTAQRNNILAAKLVAETIRTTLGPKGMDKMLVDSMGDITVTNDGVTILEEMHIEHPVAKMMVEIAKTQENEVGDGTTTAVVIAGELLKNAERLLDNEIHPTVIIKGYRLAAEKSLSILNEISEKISENETASLKDIALTAMTGKGAEMSKEKLADLVVNGIKKVMTKKDGKTEVDVNDIKLEKKEGGRVEDSDLIEGIILDKEKLHPSMPSVVKKAKIALLDVALEIKSPETDAKIEITSPDQLQAFVDQEEKMLRNMVDVIVKSGANVVLCQKGIDDLIQHFLAKKGIYAARRIKKSDMESLAKATGASIISNLKDLNAADLGDAGLVESRKIGEDEMTYVGQCKNPKAVSLMIRGGTKQVIDEVERAIKDALGDIASALKTGKILAGAGATEIELSLRLRKFATKLSGREQLAVLSFADSLEIIPKTLAENAGFDPIDILTGLKEKHESGMKWAGLDAFTGKIIDAWKNKVLEPLSIKTQAISSAAEVTELILRIDDIIAASGKEKPNFPSPKMGGMGDMD